MTIVILVEVHLLEASILSTNYLQLFFVFIAMELFILSWKTGISDKINVYRASPIALEKKLLSYHYHLLQ